MDTSELFAAASPIEPEDRPRESTEISEGLSLALSGGGYRAMLFHVGAIWRLAELQLLQSMKRISCVSGGSIAGATLGLKWQGLAADGWSVDAIERDFVAPIRALAGRTVDRAAVFSGILLLGSVWERVRDSYDEVLFGGATLQDLPDGDPRIVLNATNVQSGALLRFMRPYLRDWKIGELKHPTTLLSEAVAASSAFPPVLSPVRLKFNPESFTQGSWAPGFEDDSFRREIVLTDGGVYDNIGIETVWKRYRTVFVSDGGGRLSSEIEPHDDWARHALRVNGLIDSQVRALRKRQVVASLVSGIRTGAYWSIHLDPNEVDWRPHFTLPCLASRTRELAETPTRLARLGARYQERLINWGYASCDATLRRFYLPRPGCEARFPYPDSGV